MLTPTLDARAPRPNSARTMIRILIADDHAIVRAGLRQFIADHADMQVAAEAATGTEAIAAVRAQEFDVVLLDISMPDKNGIDTLKTIKHVRPELPVLMLSGVRRGSVRGQPAACGRGRLPQQGSGVVAARQRHPHRRARPQVRQPLAGADPRGRRVGRRGSAAARVSSRSASSRSSASWRQARQCRRSPTSSICPSRR